MTVHLVDPQHGRTICCDRTPHEVLNDQLTFNRSQLTCPGRDRQRFTLTISAPFWMFLDNEVRDMYAQEMWRELVRQARWVPEDEPDIRHEPHPDKFDAINVSGLARPLVIPAVPQPLPGPPQHTHLTISFDSTQFEQAFDELGQALDVYFNDDYYDDDLDESWADAASWSPGMDKLCQEGPGGHPIRMTTNPTGRGTGQGR